jgi:hypothetical protein
MTLEAALLPEVYRMSPISGYDIVEITSDQDSNHGE